MDNADIIEGGINDDKVSGHNGDDAIERFQGNNAIEREPRKVVLTGSHGDDSLKGVWF